MEVSIVGFLAGLELAGLVWMKWRSIVCADHGSHVPELASIRFEVGFASFYAIWRTDEPLWFDAMDVLRRLSALPNVLALDYRFFLIPYMYCLRSDCAQDFYRKAGAR